MTMYPAAKKTWYLPVIYKLTIHSKYLVFSVKKYWFKPTCLQVPLCEM